MLGDENGLSDNVVGLSDEVGGNPPRRDYHSQVTVVGRLSDEAPGLLQYHSRFLLTVGTASSVALTSSQTMVSSILTASAAHVQG